MNYNLSFDFANADTMYLTHSLHPYPAKFPPQLPKTILSRFARKGQTVLDPFCGSGTTLVEARLLGYNAIGVDVNGLSSLLSKVKATSFFTKLIIKLVTIVKPYLMVKRIRY
jgi:site-specific DNA-methyltransferase (cytosine-N4-specific)